MAGCCCAGGGGGGERGIFFFCFCGGVFWGFLGGLVGLLLFGFLVLWRGGLEEGRADLLNLALRFLLGRCSVPLRCPETFPVPPSISLCEPWLYTHIESTPQHSKDEEAIQNAIIALSVSFTFLIILPLCFPVFLPGETG